MTRRSLLTHTLVAAAAVLVTSAALTLAGPVRTRPWPLAPDGTAYCPADQSTPHPVPCLFRSPADGGR